MQIFTWDYWFFMEQVEVVQWEELSFVFRCDVAVLTPGCDVIQYRQGGVLCCSAAAVIFPCLPTTCAFSLMCTWPSPQRAPQLEKPLMFHPEKCGGERQRLRRRPSGNSSGPVNSDEGRLKWATLKVFTMFINSRTRAGMKKIVTTKVTQIKVNLLQFWCLFWPDKWTPEAEHHKHKPVFTAYFLKG